MSTAGSVGPGQRTKILHIAQCSQKKRQREREKDLQNKQEIQNIQMALA